MLIEKLHIRWHYYEYIWCIWNEYKLNPLKTWSSGKYLRNTQSRSDCAANEICLVLWGGSGNMFRFNNAFYRHVSKILVIPVLWNYILWQFETTIFNVKYTIHVFRRISSGKYTYRMEQMDAISTFLTFGNQGSKVICMRIRNASVYW